MAYWSSFMIKSERGSYALYFMIILSAFLMFFGLLIDFAKIKLAEYEIETAALAAVRSGLSYFDEELYRFGLFAMASEQEGHDIGKRVAEKHLGALSDYRFTIDEQHQLGNHAIFRQQILEEMKYKAPIEFTVEVIDKFLNSEVNQQIHAATALHKKLDELEKLREEREEVLDHAMDLLNEWIGPDGYVDTIYKDTTEMIDELRALAAKIQNYTKEQVTEEISQLNNEILLNEELLSSKRFELQQTEQSLNETEDEELKKLLKKDIEDLERSIDRLEEELEHLNVQLAEWQQILTEIKQYEQGMQQIGSQLQEQIDEMRNRNNEWDQAISDASSLNQQLKREIEQAISKGTLDSEVIAAMQANFVIDQGVFNEFRGNAATMRSLFQSFANSWNADLSPVQFLEQVDEINQSHQQYYQNAQAMYANYDQWDSERKAENEQIEDEKKSTLSKISSTLDQLKELFVDCEGSPSYDDLKEKQKHYLQLNQLLEDPPGEEPSIKDATKMSNDSIGILGTLQKAMFTVRDRAYINEYALMQFNYRTYDDKKNETAVVKSNPGQRKLKKQEVEYILYGFNSCTLNHTAAFIEMFTVRMGIRTMEALLDPKNSIRALSPWLAFLLAALEGAIEAFEDMKKLVKGEEVKLTKKWSGSLTLNYKDYLRLFMIIHGNETKMLTRMQALIDWNTGRSLDKKYTFAKAQIEAEAPLWLLPNKNREVVREAVFSY